MVGVSLADGLDAGEVAARALDAGLVLNVPGSGMLRFLPPLVIATEDVDSALAILRDVLA
jgi:acetylornithine/N-succinyldiaminopimelate aminotransferase